MGDRVLAQPPTGYPDVGNSWISPDMLLTRMNFAADLVGNRLDGARVQADALRDTQGFIRLIAPDSLSAATRTALAETEEKDALALLLAAPEFKGDIMNHAPAFKIRRTWLRRSWLAAGFSGARRGSATKRPRQSFGRRLSARRHGRA